MAGETDSDTCADIGEATSQHSAISRQDEQSDCELRVIESPSCLATKNEHLLENLESMAKPGNSVATLAQTTELELVSENTKEDPRRREWREKEGLEGRREMYSREEMEALRFANMAEQRKVWKIVCEGLDVAVRKAYDDLTSSKRNRHRLVKKEKSSETLGEECSEVKDQRLTDILKSEFDGASPLDAALTSIVGDEDDYAAVGEDTEDDDSDEEYNIQRPAFLVEGEPNFDSGPPEDGLEYLRRVRWEAAKIPKVRVAKLDKNKLNKEQSDYMPKIPDIAKCKEHLLPSKQWEDAFVAEFSQLRMDMSHFHIPSAKSSVVNLSPIKLPMENYSSHLSGDFILCDSKRMETATAFNHYLDCSGTENENDQLSNLSADEDNNISLSPDKSISKSSVNEDRSNYPMLSLILKMDSVARVSMLKKKISSFCGMDSLQKNDCQWLFALCAVVDTPLDADTCASLRSLLRKSASLRAEKSVHDDEVVMMNILATISGRYFGQLQS